MTPSNKVTGMDADSVEFVFLHPLAHPAVSVVALTHRRLERVSNGAENDAQ